MTFFIVCYNIAAITVMLACWVGAMMGVLTEEWVLVSTAHAAATVWAAHNKVSRERNQKGAKEDVVGFRSEF